MSSAPSAKVDASGVAFDTKLLETQLALVCRLSPAALRSGIYVGALIAWILSSDSSVRSIIIWLALLLAVSLGRLWIQAYYMRHAAELDVRRWVRIILVGLAINGFVWGIPCIWLVPTDPARQTVLAILSIGIAATAIASLAPVRHAYLALLVPFMMPIAVSYVALDENFRTVAFGIVLFIIAMLRIAHRQHFALHELLKLQLELQAEIAQRERTEAELRIAKSEAEAANRAKGQFLANMSHELRTPLNGVLGMSELLMRSTAGKQLKHAQTIRNAGMRLLRIISDILDMSRMEAGALPLSRNEFSPRELSAEVLDLLFEHAAKKGLALTVNVESSVPQCVLSDKGRIQQVLSNLVDNAIKFTGQGSVAIHVSSRPDVQSSVEPRAIVRWEVRDTGIGIAADAETRLFKPFAQLDESSTRKFGGAGLGLAISRQLIEALGGSIGFVSTPGVGATFWFELPCDVAERKPAALNVPPVAASRRAGHVLIVEDNPINRELAAEILQAAGCTVTTASDGEQALARIASTAFDLVLMDWHMPIMDGLTATRRVRELESAEKRARLPIIALTASVLPGDREACEAAGMDGFIAKPFSSDEILAQLDRWLAPATSEPQASLLSAG